MIEEFSFLGFPLCSREVRKIAHDFAEANGFEGFSKQSNEAGRKWFTFLLKRYPKLKVKEGVTNLSIARAQASNHDSVTTWYKKYQNVLDQLEITDPRYIWNIDEHGSEDMPKVKKIIGLKGIKQFQKQPHEKPKRTTMLTYVNAAGFALPPLVIHKGKYHDSWRNHCPRQVIVRGSKKGYINKFLFAEYGKRLIYHLHAAGQLDKPNLILMDSHYSHVFNYCYMKMMFDKDIKVMALEAHSSHFAQPLDKNPFSAFKQEFNFQMKRFNRSVGGRAITKQEFFPVFNIAWNKAMTPANIKAGFKRSGIWPPDMEVLPNELFSVSGQQCESSGLVLMLKELVQLCFSVCVCPLAFIVDPVIRFSLYMKLSNFFSFTAQSNIPQGMTVGVPPAVPAPAKPSTVSRPPPPPADQDDDETGQFSLHTHRCIHRNKY